MKALVALLLVLALVDDVKSSQDGDGQCKDKRTLAPRPHSVTLTEFGAVGDGVTMNTLAFQNAIFYLKSFSDKGGAQLYVPKGKWLTGSFNLTSHLTLFLDKGAVIIATQDLSLWSPVDPLPSYGRGIELPGDKYQSLIHGNNLTDVIITGDNGTIDGQGSIWWDSFRSHSLNYSRPHLVELVNSEAILISNLTFLNPPAWTIHPVYCSNVELQNLTISAPSNSPFTSGLLVPDSCSEICIEDCTITVGHDAISLKSGWDEYGILYSKPSSNIYITNVFLNPCRDLLSHSGARCRAESPESTPTISTFTTRISPSTSGQRRAEGVSWKTSSYVEMQYVETAIQFTGNCSRHPDERYDPKALPVVDRVTIKNVIGTNISVAGALYGIEHDPFTAICLSNINMTIQSSETSISWTCSNVSGFSEKVYPEPCSDLQILYSNSSLLCYSLENYNYSLATA